MKIICSTSFSKEPLRPTLEEVKALGFAAVDLIAIGGWGHVSIESAQENLEAEVARVEKALEETGLQAVAANGAFAPHLHQREDPKDNRERLERVRVFARLLKRLGIPFASFYPGYLGPGVERPWREAFEDTVRTMGDILNVAKEEGVELLVEPHAKTPLDTPDRVRALFERLPDARIAYDPSHFVEGGFDLKETGFMLERAPHCHVRGAAEGKLCAPLAESTLDLEWFFGALHDRGYEGYVSVEYLPKKDQPVRDEVRRLKERLESLAGG